MKYKCVIFDCDGILVDSEQISAKVFQTMMQELGADLDFDVVLDQITGTSMKENLKFFSRHLGKSLPEQFEQEFRKRSYERFKTDLKPIEGVHELLKKIEIPVGVASSGPVEKIKQNLETTNLIHYFGDNIFSSYEIGSWKPDPQIYLYASGRMGFKPEECAIIEDSIPGITAAKAGGFDVFGFAGSNSKSSIEKLGANVFYTMDELEKYLVIE